MKVTYLAAVAAVVAAVVLVLAVTSIQRRRLARRFARRLSPYERQRVVGDEIPDPEEWTRG
jgi:predicted protein tyrosine phosphatase